jgi:hypothetical protein
MTNPQLTNIELITNCCAAIKTIEDNIKAENVQHWFGVPAGLAFTNLIRAIASDCYFTPEGRALVTHCNSYEELCATHVICLQTN